MSFTAIIPSLGPLQSPMHWVPTAPSLGVKWLGRKAGHSPTSYVDVKSS
jgi:hypothetical protein